MKWVWVNEADIPPDLWLLWPDGVDCAGDAFDPVRPIWILAEIQLWEDTPENELNLNS